MTDKAAPESILLLYVTAANAEEAERIADTLVEDRLAACANIFPEIRSVYRWQGKICHDKEVALILKTRACLADLAIARIKTLHSYECPCIVTAPVTNGNPDFLNWIQAETS